MNSSQLVVNDSAAALVTLEDVKAWSRQCRQAGRRVVATNGCFDLLHPGHLHLLQSSAALGDCLVVGVNSDDSVKRLKGSERPILAEAHRATLLRALRCVAAVHVFGDLRATAFLAAAQPDIWVKGGDYTLEQLEPTERAAVEQAGGKIVLMPFLPGWSTTGILRRIAQTT